MKKQKREQYKSPTRIISGDDGEESKDEMDVTHEGTMHRESGERKLKGYWYKLRNKDLYYYKKPTDEKQKGMYALSNVFIKEEDP